MNIPVLWSHHCERETATMWSCVFLAPTRLRHPPLFFANFSEKWGRAGNNKMKLYLIFILIDLMVLLAYPVVFLLGKLRKILKFRR
jgi:hypothetical protein